MFVIFGAVVVGLVRFTVYFNDWLTVLNQITTAFLVLFLLTSVIPSARNFTGNWIVICSYVFGILLWLFCLVVTYEFWGLFGVFMGAVLFGVGIFVTALVALVVHGDISSAGLILFSLVMIYGVRMLGYWIASRYHSMAMNRKELLDRVTSGKADMADWMEADGYITCKN